MDRGSPRYSLRIRIIKYAVLSIMCTYGVYLFVVQVAQGYLYSERAQRSRQRVEAVVARRGVITDTNGRVIADNEYNYALSIVLGSLTETQLEELIERLSIFTAVPTAELRKSVGNAQERNAYSVEIVDALTLQQISYIAEHSHLFPNVRWRARANRVYPFHEELAHVTGYIGDISTKELQTLHNQGYEPHATLGKSGMELQYDQVLRGRDGSNIVTVDAFGVEIDVENTIDPLPGHNVVTSIDTRIQKLAWDALGRRIGSVIVMRPHNGEIVAMVSYPSYNPNQFYTSDAQNTFNTLLTDPDSPLINRAIQTSYPPASVFKVLMATVIANEQVYDINSTIFCKGYYALGNTVLHEWDRQNFGYLDLFGGMANSSNVYFWTLGVEHVGIERIVDYSHKFGFGSKTGIDLPNEAVGLVPDPEWKRVKFNQRWTAGDTANVSIGQGFLNTTPLQIANMAAAISNNGLVYKPHILKEIRKSETGEVVKRYTPEILRELQFNSDTFQVVQKAMRGVIETGTAHSVITTSTVSIAGKTGTSEVKRDSDNYHSWFLAYAPTDGPPESQVVVVVFVDAANEWEWWAPKAANIILHGIFSNVDYEKAIYELRNSPRGLWYL